jgi:uncharacterized protein (DUF1810 family)
MENGSQKEMQDLNRFIIAQASTYDIALSEIISGKKRTHWMWYIFPQLRGLGQSRFAQLYGIRDRNEAEAYLEHPVLGVRLCDISQALLQLKLSDAHAVFGSPDDKKLQSSMTLFSSVPSRCHDIFKQVLDKFFQGKTDHTTVEILDNDLSSG